MNTSSLLQILESFNAPINEEQSWALCFQTIKFLKSCSFEFLKNITEEPTESIITLESLVLTSEGNVVSVFKKGFEESSQRFLTEKMILKFLGVTLFQALDYGLNNSEEQKLSERLENLIIQMTGDLGGKSQSVVGVAGDVGDEGIVDDDEKTDLSFNDVLEECQRCINDELEEGEVKEVGVHCKAVCRALFHEASELNTFLERMTTEKEFCALPVGGEDEPLCSLERKDWARLWMQVMGELRRGVKLKKVELMSGDKGSRLAFELTPYEILMDDVRSKKYKLNKPINETTTDSYPMKVQKDVHDIILEFIRSRPPLQPVSKRGREVVEEARGKLEPREQLMMDIRSQQHQLRPTSAKSHCSQSSLQSLNPLLSPTFLGEKPTKKIIKPDLNLFSFSDFNDEEEEDQEDIKEDIKDHNTNSIKDKKDVKSKLEAPKRPVLTPLSPKSPPLHLPWQHAENQSSSFFFSNPSDQQPPSSASFNTHAPMACYNKNLMVLTGSENLKSIPSSANCLSLTIEEIMHIRSVLTKAELECLSSQPNLYQLLESGKVCFTCKKVKFSLLFGPWPHKCKFCNRNVCAQCSNKMRIPTEHFEHIPVYTLNPCSTSHNQSFEADSIDHICGSAPSSPGRWNKRESPKKVTSDQKKDDEGVLDRISSKLSSQSVFSSISQTKRNVLRKSDTLNSPCNGNNASSLLPGGPLMTVCCECRNMVVSIVKASRRCLSMMSKKNSAIRSERAYSACPPSRNNFPISTPHSNSFVSPNSTPVQFSPF